MKFSKSVLFYLVYLVLGSVLLHYGGMGIKTLEQLSFHSFDRTYYILAFTGFYFLAGMFVGLPSLLQKRKQYGTWTMNRPMFRTLFLLPFLLLLYVTSLHLGWTRLPPFLIFLLHDPFPTVLPLFCGAMLLQSFEKKTSSFQDGHESSLQ
ncbi:hypothetical protein SAMN05444955_11215 [Lihuaxuella thermophila]|uniref:Uncharacterized protein n=2 Tax=Lihuaxuella thermophila TaxID=1173111 RepID=A0A1H8GPY5_9BACL|nr:hypothetical protein SAMN05444955_11215 [Lihuaxuella thermophila]